MPAQSLQVPYRTFLERNHKHVLIANALPRLEPALQKALAELVLIRAFDRLFSRSIPAGAAYRLACGTAYVDGTSPSLLVSAARSTSGGRWLFENHARKSRPKYVKWSKTTFIKDTTQHVIDPADPFILACDAHSLLISEMQAVRNRIAHRNANSRRAFDVILRRYYGGAPQGVTPGTLLVTQRVHAIALTDISHGHPCDCSRLRARVTMVGGHFFGHWCEPTAGPAGAASGRLQLSLS